MRLRQPVQLDLRSILEAAFEAKDECPEMFMGFMAQQFVEDGWHERGEEWVWHASALEGCERASVYNYAGIEREPTRVESMLTFSVGHLYHALMQFGLAVHPDYDLIGHEIGGKSLGLAARCDAVFRAGDSIILIDVKTEAANSGLMRRKDAKERESATTVRPDHEMQIHATAKVLFDCHQIVVDEAWVCYVDKDSGDVDQQPVAVSTLGTVLVQERVRTLDSIAIAYDESGALPDVLPITEKIGRDRRPYMAKPWRCAPRSESDERGKWCPYRLHCNPEGNRKAS
jgi:hypothetical protein